ncbi:TonB-dependent receptor plug domain-containing protein [Aquamicrobium terrae]|uniref:Hemoglobin/transferrin/lactoferrin receptor protein n=1 Tax=Aquamicrobium terrae TaxID=1324945 RepID=A0ABV2MY69_9HYPH
MNDTTIPVGRKARCPSGQAILKAAALALLISSAPAAIGTVHAQALEKDGVTWLDTITVVGTRTETSVQDNPASVTVVDQEEMEKKAPESIAEMLRDVPGVQVVDSSAPGMKRLSIRGESSRRVTILVDGQEITDHSTYGTPILVDPSNVERIEVVRGPSSVLHGAKAIGGVINIVTKRGADKPIQAELGGSYYSGTAGWQGWAAVSGTVDNFDYRFSGSLDDHGDRRVPEGRYTSTGRLDNTSFNNDNLSAHLGYTFGEEGNHYIALKAEQHRLSTESWIDHSTLEYPVTDFNIDLPQRDLRKVGVYYDGTDINDVVRKVHLDAYYQTVDREFRNEVLMQPSPRVSVGVASTSDDRIINYGGTAQVDLQLHPDHYTIFGVQYLTDNLQAAKTSTMTTTLHLPPPPVAMVTPSWGFDDASIHTVSGFAQNEWSFADDFKLTTGARYYYSRTVHDYSEVNSVAVPTRPNGSDGRFVTSAGLTYTGIENTTLRTLYSEGYITPTLLQLFTDTSAGSGETTHANANLAPETSRNVEIGARYNAGDFTFDVAGFYTKARNYITSVPCTAGAGCPVGSLDNERIYINADSATSYGIELAAEYAVPGTAFTPYVSATWMRRQMELTGSFGTMSTYNTNTPALSGRFGVRWEGEVANHATWADLFVRAATGVEQTNWVIRRAPGVSGFVTNSLPGWATLNFAFGGSFGDEDKYSYAVSFNNILNKEYRPSLEEIPGVGRSIEASLRMKF